VERNKICLSISFIFVYFYGKSSKHIRQDLINVRFSLRAKVVKIIRSDRNILHSSELVIASDLRPRVYELLERTGCHLVAITTVLCL
jgi:hypothetical protein